MHGSSSCQSYAGEYAAQESKDRILRVQRS